MDTERVAQKAKFQRPSVQALSCLLLGHSIRLAQRRSNWVAAELTPEQVSYAATDAWVCREISLVLAPLWLPDRGGMPRTQTKKGAEMPAEKRAAAPTQRRAASQKKAGASPKTDAFPKTKRQHTRKSTAAP